jgi:Autographiviridae endonuclease
MPRARLTIRFWRKVKRRSPSDCWLWTAGRSEGYGQISVRGRMLFAHRVSWVMRFRRRIPPGLLVLHRCDTPACVNWRHLRLGTHANNIHDMMAKGRGNFVGCPPKLTAHNVVFIRKLWSRRRMEQKQIARLYGVTQSTISLIVNRKRWQHVGALRGGKKGKPANLHNRNRWKEIL